MTSAEDQSPTGKRIKALEAKISEYQRKEKALLGNVEKFQTLFERIPLGYQSLDAEGRFLEVNQTWLDILGYSRDEVIARSFADFLHPDWVEKFRRNFPRFLAAGEIHDVEFMMIRKDGTTIWVTFDGNIARDREGKFQQTHCLLKEGSKRGGGRQETVLLKTILEAIPNPFYVIDAHDYTIKLANQAAIRGELPGNLTCYVLTHRRRSPCSSKEHPCPLAIIKETGRPAVVEHVHYDKNGRQRDMEVHGFPIYDEAGNLQEMIEYSLDITKRKEAERKLAHMATHDILTGLPNRALFNIRLNLEMTHARRNKRKLAILLLDLDGFKEVNDTYGHAVGDELLQAVAEILMKQTRASDTVARLGGDEFLLLFPDIKQESDAESMAEKIVKTLARPVVLDGLELKIGASLGFAVYPDDGENGDDLVKYADIAMYHAKRGGGSRFQRYYNNMVSEH